jgi:hypothetical protein
VIKSIEREVKEGDVELEDALRLRRKRRRRERADYQRDWRYSGAER